MTDGVKLIQGDCLDVLRTLPDGCVDAVVTDPPYHLTQASRAGSPRKNDVATPFGRPRLGSAGFMGKTWDGGDTAFRVELWRECLRALRPSGYLLAFGGTRTYHRMTCAIEDAGLEIRDCIMWLYGSGFPKAKSCLKPAYEPITLARKPGDGVLPLGIDECRVPTGDDTSRTQTAGPVWSGKFGGGRRTNGGHLAGRWPPNVCHDGSAEVMEAVPDAPGRQRACSDSQRSRVNCYAAVSDVGKVYAPRNDAGTAARFFYCAKAGKLDRGEANTHPTVKPVALMEWLTKIVSPPGGLVLDPFMGSGTTGVACLRTGRRFVGVEVSPEYCEIARRRIDAELARTPLLNGVKA